MAEDSELKILFLERNLNTLMVFILCGVLGGAYFFELVKHEQPCPLCMLQRLGMFGITIGALLNVKFGIRNSHYTLSLFSAIFGASVSFRQFLLHACPQEKPYSGPTFLHLSLYTWAFIVFISTIVYISALMYIFDRKKEVEPVRLRWWHTLAFDLILILCIANILTTFLICGAGFCEG